MVCARWAPRPPLGLQCKLPRSCENPRSGGDFCWGACLRSDIQVSKHPFPGAPTTAVRWPAREALHPIRLEATLWKIQGPNAQNQSFQSIGGGLIEWRYTFVRIQSVIHRQRCMFSKKLGQGHVLGIGPRRRHLMQRLWRSFISPDLKLGCHVAMDHRNAVGKWNPGSPMFGPRLMQRQPHLGHKLVRNPTRLYCRSAQRTFWRANPRR